MSKVESSLGTTLIHFFCVHRHLDILHFSLQHLSIPRLLDFTSTMSERGRINKEKLYICHFISLLSTPLLPPLDGHTETGTYAKQGLSVMAKVELVCSTTNETRGTCIIQSSLGLCGHMNLTRSSIYTEYLHMKWISPSIQYHYCIQNFTHCIFLRTECKRLLQ